MSPAILSVGLLDLKKVERTEEIHLPREKCCFDRTGLTNTPTYPGTKRT